MALVKTEANGEVSEEFKGCVLETGHTQSYRVMSDIWCSADFLVYWNAEKQRPQKITYKIYDSMCNDTSTYEAHIDADPEVIGQYEQYLFELNHATLKKNAELKHQISKLPIGWEVCPECDGFQLVEFDGEESPCPVCDMSGYVAKEGI